VQAPENNQEPISFAKTNKVKKIIVLTVAIGCRFLIYLKIT
jgi:hypothetical protein